MTEKLWIPRWDVDGQPEMCPTCGHQIESLEDDTDQHGERCPRCGWTIMYDDDHDHSVTWS